jgi:hypothetical protein
MSPAIEEPGGAPETAADEPLEDASPEERARDAAEHAAERAAEDKRAEGET